MRGANVKGIELKQLTMQRLYRATTTLPFKSTDRGSKSNHQEWFLIGH